MSLCIGLSGGIASGKSTVARHFSALGVPLIDADQVARDVVTPGSAGLAAVVESFGPTVLQADGALDRRQLRSLIFADPALRKQLESLLHPLIRQGLRDWRQQLRGPYGILMAPLMHEAGFDALVDRILVVDVDRDTQLQRLMQRDDIDAVLAEQMLQAQADRASRLRSADDVVDNSGPESDLAAKIKALHSRYLKLAA